MIINKDAVILAMRKSNIATQTELAERLGISKSQLSQMLSEDFCPIKTNVLNLIQELNVSFNSIISEKVGEETLLNEVVSDYVQTELLDSEKSLFNRFDYKIERYKDVKETFAARNYTVLETFAGAGGLALGLEQAGFHSVGAVELDPTACRTLKSNRPNWNIIEGDINEIAKNGIRNSLPSLEGELDLLSGGYPCQSFSYAGKRHGLEDTRGTLFHPYSLLLKEMKPKAFIAENVKGLINHDKGRTLEIMLEVFEEAGYNVQWNVLNAWDYDVAQKRERIVIVGIRNDLVENQAYPYSFPRATGLRPVLKNILNDTPTSEGVGYSEKKKAVLDLVPPGGSWIDLPDEIAREYMGASYNSGGGRRGMARRISWDEPSLTLTTSPSQKQTERCHPSETRPFTVREYARIQSFPDDWIFEGGIGAKYKQIGNAVPVTLAKYIGLSLIDYLNQF